uniref:Riboflavin kinase n=1 Tax=Ignisphaera aggregans TaxID=334771 RepID=A0A7C5XJH9_9CREN
MVYGVCVVDRCISLRGRVFSGIGEGRIYVSLYKDVIRRVLGIEPYPGTLNIALDNTYIDIAARLFKSKPHFVIEAPAPSLAKGFVWKAYIDGVNCFIVRPSITVYSFDVVEVISDVMLRDCLGLVDGSTVIVKVPLDVNDRC